jgi:hypothetical protein
MGKRESAVLDCLPQPSRRIKLRSLESVSVESRIARRPPPQRWRRVRDRLGRVPATNAFRDAIGWRGTVQARLGQTLASIAYIGAAEFFVRRVFAKTSPTIGSTVKGSTIRRISFGPSRLLAAVAAGRQRNLVTVTRNCFRVRCAFASRELLS